MMDKSILACLFTGNILNIWTLVVVSPFFLL